MIGWCSLWLLQTLMIRSDGTRTAFLSDLETHYTAIEEASTALNNLILQGETKEEILKPKCDQCTAAIDAFNRASKHIKGFVVPRLVSSLGPTFCGTCFGMFLVLIYKNRSRILVPWPKAPDKNAKK